MAAPGTQCRSHHLVLHPEPSQKARDELSKEIKYTEFCQSNIRDKNLNTPYTGIQSKGFHSSVAWPYCIYTVLHCAGDVKGIF